MCHFDVFSCDLSVILPSPPLFFIYFVSVFSLVFIYIDLISLRLFCFCFVFNISVIKIPRVGVMMYGAGKLINSLNTHPPQVRRLTHQPISD